MDLQIRPSPVTHDGDQVVGSAVPNLPTWVGELAALPIRFVTARVDGVRSMDILTFQQRVFEAYQTVFRELEAESPSCPVRFWAFIPGIHDDLGAGLDRYMAFNAGRYGAFATQFGRPTAFDRSAPTASAVGIRGDQFVLHGLAAASPGRPVENPRQVSAYHYSRRFGPMPPCFARATLIGTATRESVLIVGGTASITGEESRHADDLQQQALETFRNLANVVAAAVGLKVHDDATLDQLRPLLAAFRNIRIYHPRESDAPLISTLVTDTFSPSCRIELVQAWLCRPELLIEIEGLAMPHGRAVGSSLASLDLP